MGNNMSLVQELSILILGSNDCFAKLNSYTNFWTTILEKGYFQDFPDKHGYTSVFWVSPPRQTAAPHSAPVLYTRWQLQQVWACIS